ncbi:MAG: CNP1-like family protein [Sulfuricella sp.]|nr:CNP1-like family protein [Sulfuricella sp.]
MKILWLCLLLAPLAVQAGEWGKEKSGRFEQDFDNEKPWVEIQEQLPPVPKEENLLKFFVSSATDNQFFVDGSSLNVGQDGVLRYVLLIESSSGSANLTFEGMRCASRERKLYAIGRPDGTWVRARNPRWEPIRHEARNRYHHVLYDDFFCPDGLIVTSPQQAVEAFRRERLR